MVCSLVLISFGALKAFSYNTTHSELYKKDQKIYSDTKNNTLRITSETDGFKLLRQNLKYTKNLIIQAGIINPSNSLQFSIYKSKNIEKIIQYSRLAKTEIKIWIEITSIPNLNISESEFLPASSFLSNAKQIGFDGYLTRGSILNRQGNPFEAFSETLENGYIFDSYDDLNKVANPLRSKSIFYVIAPYKIGLPNNVTFETVFKQIDSLREQFLPKSINLIFQLDSFVDTIDNGKTIWSETISYKNVIDNLITKKLDIEYSDKFLTPFISYQNKKYWLSDSSFIYNTLNRYLTRSLNYQITSYGISATVDFDPQALDVLNKYPDKKKVNQNYNEAYFSSEDANVSGQGSIYKIHQEPQVGERMFAVDDKGLIQKQLIKKNSTPLQIKKEGYLSNKIALSFDDGPDPINTPKILKILQEKNVKAAFYLKGENVILHPEIANEIVKQGHVIGNHTYTHPDTNFISLEKLVHEVYMTNKTIVSATNTKTKLYRTPKQSTNFDKPTEFDFRNLRELTNQGYIVVESDLDSLDFLGLSVEEIKSNVGAQINDSRSQILFHDFNEVNNSNVVLALPSIIDAIRSKNIEIVNIDSLTNLNQDIYQTNFNTPIELTLSRFRDFIYKNYWIFILFVLLINLFVFYY